MFSLTIHNLWARKRRLVATVLAVALGTAFLTGTMVLGDTMRATFATIFANGNAGVDVVVSAPSIETEMGTEQARLERSVLNTVRDVDGVARAAGVMEGYGKLVGKHGQPVGSFGPPNTAANWIDDAELSPYRLVDGRAPTGDHEVVVNRAALTAGALTIGDSTSVQMPDPVQVTVVGAVTYGDVDSAGGSTWVAFSETGAQRWLMDGKAQLTRVVAAAQPGIGQDELKRRVSASLPAPATPATTASGDAASGGLVPTVQTGTETTAAAKAAIDNDFLGFFTAFLNAFGVVAVLVATFSIANTFAILAAQRTRESALLRALGATRRQVLRSALGESVVLGVVASVLGIGLGVALAVGLKGALAGLGMSVPASGLTLQPGTLAIGFATGLVVTVFAAVMPARKASAVPPIAALRDVAHEGGRSVMPRTLLGTAIAGGGALLTMSGSAGGSLARAGLGAALLVVGVVVLGPAVAGFGARILGWPIARFRGVTGQLARDNAARNPRRTASTGSALMIGVSVVTLFTVFATSLAASVRETVGRSFTGDLVVSAGQGNSGFSPQLARDVASKPGVKAAVGLGTGGALIDGKATLVGIADPQPLVQVLDMGVVAGSIGDLTAEQIGVSKNFADERKLVVGSTIPLTFVDGRTQPFSIGAIYTGSDLAGDVVMSRDGWAPHATRDLDMTVIVRGAEGVSLSDVRRLVEDTSRSYAGVTVQDKDQYIESVAGSITQVLGLVYVLLLLAIVIALMGIANTISLSVHERTRELGLLRAVGQTRRQVRAMVRGEALIVALFGTAGGMAVGLFLGWALVRAASSAGLGVFSAPVGMLAAVLLIGGGAGMLAAVRPARRAAKLDVLAAISS